MTGLAGEIRAALRSAAEPGRAARQQAYMKSAMPFLGVTVPAARALTQRAVRDAGPPDAGTLRAVALELWDGATHREERYAALAALAVRPLAGDPGLLPVVEHMVRTGRWWDYTDELAHRVADSLDASFDRAATTVRRWAVDDDLWMRRIAILSQLGRRERLDRQLLVDVIEPNVGDPEFFVRKAIGWALREYARVDPDGVQEFVAGHDLSALSRREALKHL